MQEIGTLFENYSLPKTDTTAKSEWAEWVGKFTDRLNEERKDTKYPPISEKRVAMLIAPFKNDIHYFFSKCDNAKNFGACFFWHTKVDKK